jgi:hypothetical protein
MSDKKLNKISLNEKYEIINKIQNGEKRKQLLIDHKLKSYANLTYIWKQRKDIIKSYNELSLKSSEKTFRLRAAKHQKVEEALIHWMKQIREKKISLSSDLILQKARRFAQMLNIDDFEPTLGYLRGLKKRNGIIFSKKHGESDSVDEEMVKKWSEELSDIIKDYKPEEVYNLDEMALFWRLLPSKTYCFTDESPYGSRKSKDRITVVVICNADGSDRTCAMIGKSVKPRAFRGIKYFPIDYYQQRNAWINGSIYEKILKKLNQKMRSLNKNILLFVDNCRTHLYDIQLSNIFVRFLPANSTSKLQVLL